jgi:hypothetical protein
LRPSTGRPASLMVWRRAIDRRRCRLLRRRGRAAAVAKPAA